MKKFDDENMETVADKLLKKEKKALEKLIKDPNKEVDMTNPVTAELVD